MSFGSRVPRNREAGMIWPVNQPTEKFGIINGNLNELDLIGALTVMVWFRYRSNGGVGSQTLFARYADIAGNDNRNQFFFGIDAAHQLQALGRRTPGSPGINWSQGGGVLSPGSRYKATFTYGIGGGGLLAVYLSKHPGGDDRLIGSTAGALSTLSDATAAGQSSAFVGGTGNVGGNYNANNSRLIDLRVWIGQALTLAQLSAEKVQGVNVVNKIAPQLWYRFNRPVNAALRIPNLGTIGAGRDLQRVGFGGNIPPVSWYSS